MASRTNRKPPPRSRPTLSPARRPRQCVARLTACLSPGRALQRGRERGGFACSRRARAASPGNALSPGSRLRSGERSAVPPVLQPALAPALGWWQRGREWAGEWAYRLGRGESGPTVLSPCSCPRWSALQGSRLRLMGESDVADSD